jgi:hypothetical protein
MSRIFCCIRMHASWGCTIEALFYHLMEHLTWSITHLKEASHLLVLFLEDVA